MPVVFGRQCLACVTTGGELEYRLVGSRVQCD